MSFPRICALLFLALFLAAPPQTVVAQHGSSASVRPVARVNFVTGVPMGSFRNNVESLGYGGNLFGGIRFGRSPVIIGADLGFLIYGRSKDTVPFSSTVGPRVMVDVVTTNQILEPHLVLRLQPAHGWVRPYVDALVGFKYLSTETTVRDEDRNDDDEEIASSTNFSDLALSGGPGAGFDIRLYRGGATSDVRAVSLHLGAQYLLGRRAEYLAEADLEDTNGNGEIDEEELDIRRSTTTLFQPQIGITLQF